MRVGIGQDSHTFEKGKPLVIGGVRILGHDGLKANSDGDVVFHALCNALLSSVGRGSLSTFADDLCSKGIMDSSEYLKVALGFVIDAGFEVVNVSIAIEGSTPKLESEIPRMRKRTAELLRIPEADAGITVTSGEGLSSFGQGKGMQAIAVVSIHGA